MDVGLLGAWTRSPVDLLVNGKRLFNEYEKSYDSQFNPTLLARTNLLKLKKNGKILNLPLYAVSLSSRLKASEMGN